MKLTNIISLPALGTWIVLVCGVSLVIAAPRQPQPPWPQPTLRTYGFDSGYYNVPWDSVAINEDLATLVGSFSGYALVREGWLAAPVVIPAASERKKPNVAPSYGSVRFWISPNWSSAGEKFAGNGPGNLARLVELVDFTSTKPVLRWSLYVNETGDSIYLTGQTGQGVKDLLQASVQFEANDWRMVTLCYSTTNVVLLIDNQVIASGAGVAAPSEAVAMNLGLVIGSDAVASLGSAAEAQFEEVTTMEHWPRKSDWQDLYFEGVKQLSLLGPKESRQKEQEKIAALKNAGLLPEDYGVQKAMGGGLGPLNMLYSTNDLWLEITEMTNQYAYLLLHGTDENKWYQLLSKTNLAQPGDWTLGEAKLGDYGTNVTVFSPVFVGDNTNMFFRAHQADGYVTIYPGLTAYEPTVAMPGRSSDYYIYSSSPAVVTVYYQMSGVAQNGVDYTNLTGFVTVPALSAVYVEVQPKPDSVVEGDESIIMTLVQTNDYMILGTDRGESVLKDYSTTIGIAGITHAVEANGPPGAPAANGSVALNRYDYRNLYPPLTVGYSLSGTASNGTDYVTLTGFVTYADQDSTANIDIIPLSDSLIEGIETVTVTLLTTNLYETPPNAATNSVNISDTTTTISVSADQSGVEPHPASNMPVQTGWFTIARDDSRVGNTFALPVSYQLSGTAANGVDYTNIASTVTIPAGAASVRVYIEPINDNQVETTEAVTLTMLTTGDSYLIEAYANAATLNIVDTTATVSLTPGVSAIEAHATNNMPGRTGTFVITRSDSRGNSWAMPVSYQMSGTASNGGDYTNLTGSVTIPADSNSATIFVEPISDFFVEANESVILTLIPFGDSYVISGSAAATITTSDTTTTVSVAAGQNAVEPNPASLIAGQTGAFTLTRSDSRGLLPALSVTYQMSGLAQNGMDYTNLTGTLTFATNQTSITNYIQPLYDNSLEGDEAVVLTLTPTTDAYRINSNAPSATITLVDNMQTNLFVPVVTNLAGTPVGIDYHQPSNSLIVSINGSGNSFRRIYTNTVSSNIVTVATNWSGVSAVPDEIKLVTVKTTANGFTNGDVYFGSSTGIGWISADGTRSNLNWCILTNSVQTNALPIRGSLCMDETGVFSNQLVVVTSPGGGVPGNKGVWRVNAQAESTLVTNINTPHLEGVIVLTNDVAKWGPWAGKIISGDESLASPPIFTIDSIGGFTAISTIAMSSGGVRAEDFDLIPPNQDLYVCDQSRNEIAILSRNYLTNYVGDLVITDELSSPSKLVVLHWDVSTTNFVSRTIHFKHSDGSNGMFEHVTFAPINLPPK